MRHLWIGALCAGLCACDDGGAEPAGQAGADAAGALDASTGDPSPDRGTAPDAARPADAAPDGPDARTAGPDAGPEGPDGGPEPQCSLRMEWLQKDAYREGPGRSSPFWPPHTTMLLSVRCPGEADRAFVDLNHGTSPDAVAPDGTPILATVAASEEVAPRGAALALAEAFTACECGTDFLSLDALDAGLVEQVVGELAGWLDGKLTCPDPGLPGLVGLLQGGDVDGALALAAQCDFVPGADWGQGFDEALGAVLMTLQAELASYHVCNNDARLQAALWWDFVGDGVVGACDAASVGCNGPAWYYEPEAP